MEVNSDRLNAFMGKMVTEVGAAMNASLILVGDKLGLYSALAAKGPMNSAELAKATGTSERYIREWLAAQAASGYIEYDAASAKFSMLPEQAMALADEDSPVFLGAVGNMVAAAFLDEPKVSDAFKTGKGVGWNRRSECLFCGTARFFRTGYKHHLVQEWLPALDGVVEKLKRGAKVADVGCGHGVSTRLMAEAFPNSRFYGFDYHEGSIAAARKAAEKAGLGDRVRFDVHSAKTYPAEGYDLVCFFDCLHDMGDPVGAMNHVREPWRRTAPACWSSRSPTTGSRTISIRSDACTTRRRRWSARRRRSIRRWASRSAPRPARHACARSRAKAA